jgi:rSAM/selenodomain-associated transferase 2
LISVIIPALNEAEGIIQMLQPLQPLRKQGGEVILVDGGSRDHTVSLATPYVDQVIVSEAGRAKQMNRGAAVATGTILWFLHADTQLPPDAAEQIEQQLQQAEWGRFNLRLSGQTPLLRVVEWMINRRSCWSGVATGDQGIFLSRPLFEQLGGYPEIPLMEDIALSKQLRQISPPCCIPTILITSSRRWEQRGVIPTILLMWWLRFAYWVGVSPQRLARWYR